MVFRAFFIIFKYNLKAKVMREIFKLIKSSDGLESILGIIILCIVIPIALLVGLVIYKLVEYFLF